MLSSLISLIIIFFSVVFGVYSFIEFMNQSPMIDYYKNNDLIINKTIEISNSFIIFRIYTFNYNMMKTNIIFECYYYSYYIDDDIPLIVEPCEYGKNIDLKHQELFKNFEKRENESINDYYCINFNKKNISFFHHPNDSYDIDSFIRLKLYLNESDHDMNFFSIKILTENDIIDHNNKKNPIIPYYYYNSFAIFNISRIISLKYDYQYIKYESDTGIFLENSKSINAIGFSSLSFDNNLNVLDERLLALIDFQMNKSNYDFYKRAYKKFQSFLADVTSLINLIITILKLMTYYLLNKKMNKDIIREIMMEKGFKEYKEKISLCKKSGIDLKLKDIDKDKSIWEFELKQNSKEVIKESNNIRLKDQKLKERNINTLKNIKLFDIIKSFFCFKDIKTNLIDLCNKIINEDICLDRILSRLYNLEKIYSLIGKGEYKKYKFYRNEEFKKIKYYLLQINHEKKLNIDNKNENDKKENTVNQGNYVPSFPHTKIFFWGHYFMPNFYKNFFWEGALFSAKFLI